MKRIIFKKLGATLMALMMATVALANPSIVKAADTPASFGITKILAFGPGTNVPADATFTFAATPYSFNDSTEAVDLDKIPALDMTKTIQFNANLNTVGVVAKQIAILFDSISWPEVGVYGYKITENDTGQATVGTTIFSKAEHILFITVTNNGTKNEVSAAVAKQTHDDEGTEIPVPSKNNAPGPGTNSGETTDLTDPDIQKGLYFKNTYVPKSTTSDSDGFLYISKEVTGDGDTNKNFSFDITMTRPTVDTTTAAFSYKKQTKSVDAWPGTTVGVDGTIDNNSLTTITLKHNERLLFSELPIGTTVTVVEASAAGYTTTVVAESGGVGATAPVAIDRGVTNLLVQDVPGKNFVQFTNYYNVPSATGIIMENLPFILIILVALIGLVIGFIGRRKREA